MKKLPTDELISQFLEFARQHFAENSSEILIGETKETPEFIIVPYKRKTYEN